ncbi:MAG: DinB family protein [Gemmatimonadota bacterium]|nr:DinB family protein [Gemmatimonadota bacterium]
MRRLFDGEAWLGPSITVLLDGVSARAAAARPIAGSHSIWELVGHITTWLMVARRRVVGEAFDPTRAEDWPSERDASDTAWRAALVRLRAAHDALVGAVSAMDDDRLSATVPGRDHSYYILLHGVAQHTAYHAGQIAILKRGTGM